MCLLCKYIGAHKRVKVTKRTQADQGKYFTYWEKKLLFLKYKRHFGWMIDVWCMSLRYYDYLVCFMRCLDEWLM